METPENPPQRLALRACMRRRLTVSTCRGWLLFTVCWRRAGRHRLTTAGCPSAPIRTPRLATDRRRASRVEFSTIRPTRNLAAEPRRDNRGKLSRVRVDGPIAGRSPGMHQYHRGAIPRYTDRWRSTLGWRQRPATSTSSGKRRASTNVSKPNSYAPRGKRERSFWAAFKKSFAAHFL